VQLQRVLDDLTERKVRFSLGAPGRAHLLGGESPLLARQGEELAERQGCRGRLRIWRKPKAKRWSDEQEADTRRRSGVRRPISSKPETCTERYDVNPTDISVKVGASYPGRSGGLPCATGIERCRDGLPEVSRGHSRCPYEPKGRTLKAVSRRRDHRESR
jgi:hypothetical protein